jgi:cysteine synthase A
VWGAFKLLAEMIAQRRSGSVVTLLADSGDRYTDTYFDAEWLTSQGLNPSEPAETLRRFESSAVWA